MAGCQGVQPGPCSAPWWLPPSPAGMAATRLAAGAGCAGCWHKLPPADGVNPLRSLRNLGASPRVRRVVFRPVLPNKVLRPWAGIEPATTAFRRGSTRLSYQWWHAWSRTRHFLSEWSPRPCRYQRWRCAACRTSTEPEGPGRPAPVGRTFVLTPACERSPLALDASSIARCVPACGEWYSTCPSC